MRGLAFMTVLGIAVSATGARASDELIGEVVYSLDASAYLKPDLAQLLRDGLDALAAQDRCVNVQQQNGTLKVDCLGKTVEGAFPPASPREVVRILDEAIAMTTPEGTEPGRKASLVARALAASLRDPWTAYVPPELVSKLGSGMQSRQAAPGIELTPRDPARVLSVRPGSPAATEGVQAGDRIVELDGQSVRGWTLAELSAALFGAEGSVLRLQVQSPEGEKRKVFIRRSIVPEEPVRSTMLEGGVLYLRIAQFNGGVARQASGKIWEKNSKAVILDLRHNHGGLISEGVALLDVFFSEGSIGGVKPRAGRPSEDFSARPAPTDSGVPLAVLVDGSTASASEFVSLVLKERKRAVLLGAPTLGKGSVQKRIRMPDRGVLKVTSARYMAPSGAVLPEHGVSPNRLLGPPQGRTVLEGGDPRGDSWVLAALDALEGVGSSLHSARDGRYGPNP